MTVPLHPLISVIIPCRNYGRFLNEAIESVLGQSWTGWECIIIDDGSTDNTAQVAEHYAQLDARIRVLSQPNRGVSAARNAGLSACTSDYVQFLDADDKIEPGKLECQVAYLLAHPHVDVVYGDVDYFHEEKDELATPVSQRLRFARVTGQGEDVLAPLIRRNIMVVNAPLIRRLAINEVGFFNQKLAGHEDWEYWIRLAMAGKAFSFLASPNTNALVRVHAASAVQNAIPMLLTNLQVRQQLMHERLPPYLKRINRGGIGLQLAKLAKLTLGMGHPAQALRYGIASIVRSRFDPKVGFFLFAPQKLLTRLMLAMARRTHRRNQP